MPQDIHDIGESLKVHLDLIYPEQDNEQFAQRVIEAFWPGELAPRDRTKGPTNELWSEQDSVVITYGDTFTDGQNVPLGLLHRFLTDHLKGTVSGVHILPFFPFSSDDGFAVIDYERVSAKLGTWKDIQNIAEDFQLMSDLVLNHASSRCQWFDEFRAGKAPGKDYFVTVDPEKDDLSKVVRPRSSDLLKPVETVDGLKHVWCTFGHDQVDLNFANPDVLIEFVKILRLHIENGVRIVRLDAVAFLWKIVGTSSLHLPETHEIIRLLRVLVNFDKEDVILLTETNVPNAENLTYFGNQNEAHVIYNFSLPPLLVHALLAGTSEHMSGWMRSMPPAPKGCTYLNFVAGHDGIGMRPSDGLLDETERVKMVETVEKFGGLVSYRKGRQGNMRPYELNIALYDALKGTIKGEDKWQIKRFLCAHAIMLGLEGIPAFYIHSLVATPNDYELFEKRNHNRCINRHVWDYYDIEAKLDDQSSHHAIVFQSLKQLIDVRRKQPAFHPNAEQFTLQLGHEFLAFRRLTRTQKQEQEQAIIVVANVTDKPQTLHLSSLYLTDGEQWSDLLSSWSTSDSFTDIELAPYDCMWLTNNPAT